MRYDLFEIDFNDTKDGRIVCIHDWKDSAKQSLNISSSDIPTLREFNRLVSASESYKSCTFDSLVTWLKNNPEKYIVTDIKDNNVSTLKRMVEMYPELKSRFIPQIYHPSEYLQVRKLGYKKVIFTLYRCRCNDLTVIMSAMLMDLYAVTMPVSRVPSLGKPLSKLGVPTYVHTINTTEGLNIVKSFGASEIYTDWLYDVSEN